MGVLIVFLITSSLLASSPLTSSAGSVQFEATNNAVGTGGGDRFTAEIGLDYSKQVLAAASKFVWDTFEQTESTRKDVSLVTLSIESYNGVAYTVADGIHFSAEYIGNYSGDLRAEFTGVLYHEVTHVWQWNGNSAAPSGLIEGIADFIRLRAGYAPSHWVKPGEGDRWDQGYDVTARFLDYCDGLKNGFVAQLNAKMKDGYSDQYFLDLLGKSVDQLWSDYKAMYAH
ncbi:uncharacterized protein [Typha angustifolia]|uniref:uncharacterized protein n=1 Tax=Typha angustifolia TaxID=59011 RepID=UPI003C2EF2E5